MSEKIEIQLEFKGNDINALEIYEYITELVENNCLDWEVVESFGAVPLRFGIWSPDDILFQANCMDDKGNLKPDSWLSKEDAHNILERIIDKHDAEIGINWGVIDCYLDEYKENKNE